jgi:hypothetical protein
MVVLHPDVGGCARERELGDVSIESMELANSGASFTGIDTHAERVHKACALCEMVKYFVGGTSRALRGGNTFVKVGRGETEVLAALGEAEWLRAERMRESTLEEELFP